MLKSECYETRRERGTLALEHMGFSSSVPAQDANPFSCAFMKQGEKMEDITITAGRKSRTGRRAPSEHSRPGNVVPEPYTVNDGHVTCTGLWDLRLDKDPSLHGSFS